MEKKKSSKEKKEKDVKFDKKKFQR